MIEVLDNSKDGIYNSNMELIDSFTDYSSKNLDFDKPVTIELMDDEENAKNPLGTTAHYNPDEMKITIYVTGRHIKDILRSISHELIHHVQNCRGDLSGMQDTSLGYAQRDKHMRDMEAEAFNSGNIMIFRDFEDNYKQGNRKMSKLQESRLKRLNQILMGDSKQLLKESEAVAAINAIEKRALQRWITGKMTDETFKSLLGQAIGGGKPGTPQVDQFLKQLRGMKRRGFLAGKEGLTAAKNLFAKYTQNVATAAAKEAGKKAAGRQLAKTIATQAGKQTTSQVLKSQAGKEIIKRGAAGALARGAGRLAAGQAIGSAVPGIGNIVMGVITGAWLMGDLMLIYYEKEKLKMKGVQAGRNVRQKCKNLIEKGVPVKTGKKEEYKEMAKDFAGAIAFNSGYINQKYYRTCLRKVMGVPGGKSYLSDAGVAIDVIKPSAVGLGTLPKQVSTCPDGTMEDDRGRCLDPSGKVVAVIKSQFTPKLAATRPKPSATSSGRATGKGPRKYRKCTGILRMGCEGDNIEVLQRKLHNVLKLKSNVDSFADKKFGPGTKRAVKAFQRRAKLKVDGVAGPDTLKALDAAVAGKLGIATPKGPGANLNREKLGMEIDNIFKQVVTGYPLVPQNERDPEYRRVRRQVMDNIRTELGSDKRKDYFTGDKISRLKMAKKVGLFISQAQRG